MADSLACCTDGCAQFVAVASGDLILLAMAMLISAIRAFVGLHQGRGASIALSH